MRSKRLYTIGLIGSVVLYVGAGFIHAPYEDLSGILGLISVAVFIISLVALIVFAIRSGIKGRATRQAPVAHNPNPQPIDPPSPSPQPQPTDPPRSSPQKKNTTTVERVHVRGLEHYTKNIVSIATENPDYSLSKRELAEYFLDERVWQYQFFAKAALVPEPENEHDPNAIMVQADGVCIGYVPKGSTGHIRKLMDSGRIKRMEINIGGGKFKEAYEDDDDKYELDRGEVKYSAVLELYLTEE